MLEQAELCVRRSHEIFDKITDAVTTLESTSSCTQLFMPDVSPSCSSSFKYRYHFARFGYCGPRISTANPSQTFNSSMQAFGLKSSLSLTQRYTIHYSSPTPVQTTYMILECLHRSMHRRPPAYQHAKHRRYTATSCFNGTADALSQQE